MEFLINGSPVSTGEAGGFLHQQGGPPLIQPTLMQGRQRVGHFRDEGTREAEEAAAAGRRLTASQRDLRPDAFSPLRGRHPGIGLSLTFGHINRNRDLGLHSSDRRLQIFQLPQLVDQARRIRGRVKGIEGIGQGSGGTGTTNATAGTSTSRAARSVRPGGDSLPLRRWSCAAFHTSIVPNRTDISGALQAMWINLSNKHSISYQAAFTPSSVKSTNWAARVMAK
ncbi:hypothetical protein GCM10009582_17250 [Arthrobacter flavus]